MYTRSIIQELREWRLSPSRKSLLIRGARQVGKTTLVNEFAQHYQQYLYLNLERKEDAAIFRHYARFSTLVLNFIITIISVNSLLVQVFVGCSWRT
jgi:uncharacterized protein